MSDSTNFSETQLGNGGAISEEKYFEKIPVWSEGEKRFEVLSDPISGRIPVTRLESWQEFTRLLENPFFNRAGHRFIFRGHRRFDWGLIPTLGRLTSSGIISKELARQQIEKFRFASRGRLVDLSAAEDDQEDELWAIGQHHELMTPLLDWTYSPYVALFFAFAKEDRNEEADNPYRVVYALNKSFVEKNREIRVFEPRKDEYGRLVNQAGLFTFSPYDSTIENKLADILSSEDFKNEELRNADPDKQAEILAQYLCKIYIKNEGREACLKHLRLMNVHHASLFPDLFGASEFCNIQMTEEYLEVESRKETENKLKLESTGPEEPVPVAREGSSISPGMILALERILQRVIGVQSLEPKPVHLIAAELAREIEKNKVVDLDTREGPQARLRNIARIVLRKFSYPEGAREQVVDELMEFIRGNFVTREPN